MFFGRKAQPFRTGCIILERVVETNLSTASITVDQLKKEKMKYLIASEKGSMSGNVSVHFGKSPFFLVYDDEDDRVDVITNGEGVDPHLVIRDSAKSGVKKIICGGIGPHAFQVAEKFEVEVHIGSGMPADEAVALASAGKLPITTEPTAHHGHHGEGNHLQHSHRSH